jgi:alpha-galactosidase
MRFDFGGPLTLNAHESFLLPTVAFTATVGDLDDGANQFHRYQRQFVVPRTPTNDPLLVQFNSWYPFPGKMNVEQMKHCADVAAQLGAEVFVLDAGWFSSKNWSCELGDWTPNRAEFPQGVEELADYVRHKGMKFGLWVEIENLGVDSKMFQQHPDWCLTYNGQPLEVSDRYQLDFAKPEVEQWTRSVIDRFVRDYHINWLKIDYNIDIGERFDPPGMLARRGDVLYRQIMSYYKWLDEIRAAYPKLVIENCSSGGLRFDLGIIAHTHTTWLSDEVRPLPSVQLAYGCTLEFIPEICNHWMVGDDHNGEVALSRPPGWWDFMFRVPMNGQFGISSRVFDWSPALKQRAAENIALYKQLRHVMMGADVYHLTPPPCHDDPEGWCAIQYVSQDQKRSVVLAYRLAQSPPKMRFKLRGLASAKTYRVLVNGVPRGTFDGGRLSASGLQIRLGDEWRAAVVELNEAQ